MKKLRDIEEKRQQERRRDRKLLVQERESSTRRKLERAEEKEEHQKEVKKHQKKKRRARNREYRIVAIFFILLFVSLAGYLVYFETVQSEDFINSPYNTRQDTFADQVQRGSILASGGEILAQTLLDWDGSEYRYYPYGALFAHAVGYESHGRMGLESEVNFQLLSSHEFFLDQMKNQMKGEKNQGDQVQTSLDVNLQSTAYYALGDHKGAVIAMEPSTGRILAMVSKSDFDPNTLDENWDYFINDENSSCLVNRATQGQYPPGSTFKIVTALSYYRAHGSMDGFEFTCEGTLTRDDYTLQCYAATVHGQEDLSSAFANSCNTAFATLGLRMGAETLRQTAESLLFNKRLPLSMEYQRSTFTLNQKSKAPEVMQTAIGQGDTLTSPMHMAMLVSAIANEGILMKPTMIDALLNAQGDIVSQGKREEYKRLMTQEEAQALTSLMKGVVDYGTGYALSGRGYSVAGKTGSAEIDAEGNSHSWFVGFSNVEDPDLVVCALVEYGGTGSESALPVAAAVFDAYHYQNTQNSREEYWY